ncbi:MAG: tetratricopeptide repeat protein [Bacteroidetes bacterium]|nr:tetratricopeptide repeat protein [Bacteroidota bacterium]
MTFDSANSAYAKGDYQKAIDLYNRIIDSNQASSELYFNLGNAHYKANNIGLAILNYEKAKLLNPDDEDLVMNLKLANQKTEDKIDAAPQLFLSEWKNGIVNIFSEKAWSISCILFFVAALIFIGIYITSHRSGLKKLGFFVGLLLFILSIFLYFVAQDKYELTKNSSNAIVISGTATITGSPDEKGTKLFILHEGTKVEITEEQSEWTEIKIANGNVGWIKSKFISKI